MCIYCPTNNHRKIYENHCGPIPKDDQGRSFHIHHIDGNHNNNNIDNLQCVSLEEHYNIHLAQGDYAAASRLATNLGITGDEISRLVSLAAQERVKKGTHHFLDRKVARERAHTRIEAGIHHFLGAETNRKRIADGTHNLLGCNNPIHQRVKDGTHPNAGGKITRKRIADGTHPFLGPELNRKRMAAGNHNFQQEHTCPHCSKTGKGPQMFRWHFDNCRSLPET